MSAAPLDACPKDQCPRPRWGKGKVQRGIGGGAGLIFKGSGFYITDYRSEGYKSAAEKDSTTPESKPKTGSTADAKPAAKPAAADSKPKATPAKSETKSG